MSEEIVNDWKPRKPIILNLKSGSRCEVQRPGPELALKTAHLQRRLRALRKAPDEKKVAQTEVDEEEEAAKALEEMSDEQREASLEIMRVTVAACVRRPKLYLNPKPGQLGVDDIPPEDFLEIWQWWQQGCKDPADETEVALSDADRFSEQQGGGAGAGDSGGDVRGEAVEVAASA